MTWLLEIAFQQLLCKYLLVCERVYTRVQVYPRAKKESPKSSNHIGQKKNLDSKMLQ